MPTPAMLLLRFGVLLSPRGRPPFGGTVLDRAMRLALLVVCLLMGPAPLAVADEPDFLVPGSQPKDSVPALPIPIIIEHDFTGATVGDGACQGCHTQDLPASPGGPWRGSMMGNSARDPLFWAQLDLVNYDHNYRPQVMGMGDMCLRCHSPVAWLEGRSTDGEDGVDYEAPGPGESDIRFSGMSFEQKDMDGVQCHFCHRLLDPLMAGENELEDDRNILSHLRDTLDEEGESFLPPTYGNGMFVVDSKQVRRGPYANDEVAHSGVPTIAWTDVDDNVWNHPTAQSPFQRSGNLCATCHDVSNPSDRLNEAATKGDTQQGFPIERTFTEWRYSDYYDELADGGGEENNCQSCHMSGPLNSTTYGPVCASTNEHPNDIHFHDMAGANRFVPMLLKKMSDRWRSEDSDFVEAMKGLYPQTDDDLFMGIEYDADLDFNGISDGDEWQAALDDTVERAERSLRRAAYLTVSCNGDEAVEDPPVDPDCGASDDLVVRVTNRTGHKLPTGYPEGRRMWLNVVFRAADGSHLAESGYYDSEEATLYHDQNLDGLDGGEAYDTIEYTDDSGTPTGEGRPTKVWEARAHFHASESEANDETADGKEFHFALVNELVWDNRIPPAGWQLVGYTDGRALPKTDIAAYEANSDPLPYQSWQSEYAEGIDYDEFGYAYPAGIATDRVELTLYYQTSSREYIEALSADNPETLTSNGYNRGSLLLEAWQSQLDHPVHGAAVDVGKSSPMEMARLVHAVVDSDDDGLSDGWEAEYLSGDCAAEAGYNDDPDGDGQNNWQEFQAGTDPCFPDSDPRNGVDIVLVLDTSGSMSNAAPGTSTPKLTILQESVALFLNTWKDYAVPDDRLAVVYFESDVTEYETDEMPEPLKNGGPLSFADNWEDALADVESQLAGDYTAMGGGLYYALAGNYPVNLSGEENALHVILFSNGMQNMSPMVTQPVEDQLEIVNLAPGADGVQGVSNIVAVPDAFNAIIEGVSIHTIGIGVTGTNSGGDSWHELIADIAEDTGGKHHFITQAYDMEGTFLEDLVESLKGNTLEYVFEEEVQLDGDAVSVIEIPINLSASKMSIIVSWAESGVGPPDMELLAPDGTSESLDRISRDGSFFRIITRYFGDPDSHADDYGTWTLRLMDRDRQSSEVRVHALVDDTTLKYRFTAPRHLEAGQPLRVSMTALQGGHILRRIDQATVDVEFPTESVANLMSASRLSLTTEQITAYGPDSTATPYSQKLLATYESSSWTNAAPTDRQTFDLLESTPIVAGLATHGVFTETLLTANVPGHYKLHFTMVGHTLSGEHFERKETFSLFVETRSIDGHLSRVVQATSSSGEALVRLTPMDDRGNLLGPGNAFRLAILDQNGDALTVIDDLDGSYHASLPSNFHANSILRILARGELIHDGPIGSDAADPLAFVDIDHWAGSEAGGSVVNISGSGFLPGASVFFGGVEASEVIVVSDLLIQATVPEGSGDATIQITNPGGESTTASQVFTYEPVGVIPSDGLPALTGFGLGGGPVSGDVEPYAQVVVYLDDVKIGSYGADGEGRFTGPANAFIPLKNQEYVFSVEATDLSGNALSENTYIINTFVARNVARSTEGRDAGQNALKLLGGAGQTFRFVANPGNVEVSLYAKITGNVTPVFVVFGDSLPSQSLDAVGQPDALGWRRYATTLTVPDLEGSSTLTLSVSTPLATPVDATVLVDEIAILEQ